jgi:outer membrane protein assembly factor BamA
VIVGNTATPDDVILSFFELRPGQIMRPRALREAEARLRESGLFHVNRWRGITPTVEILPNDFGNEYLDVLIRIEERPWNWVAFAVTELACAALEGEPRDLHDAAYRLWRGFGGGG